MCSVRRLAALVARERPRLEPEASGVRHDRTTVFAHSDGLAPGFMELDFLTDGSVQLEVIEWSPTAEAGVGVYSTTLTSDR